MATFAKFHLDAHPDASREVLHSTLAQQGYRYTWENPQQGLAEKGSKVKAMLLGAFAMHYRYALKLDANPDGSHTVSLLLNSTGVSGGALGIAKVRTQLDELYGVLRQAYTATGTLRNSEVG
ncbi:hypothetical protein DEF23_19355 [Marinitenerispora sediminis]|uniref:Uncharacterized protein n=2 Tax=Marinitenerispora sediminis TaxID=1931232 RepID=A0A368T1P1_9ACTN|nr:hypothetical protein DEF23_19355 [Marinitenerispora sediminis]RCV54671.1 hypothetical protein DEF24_18985 [Marinitenerispora sediminis]RCV56257.1 hypothetical protein DEF28_03840 [Marinitenerispora sediminis]